MFSMFLLFVSNTVFSMYLLFVSNIVFSVYLLFVSNGVSLYEIIYHPLMITMLSFGHLYLGSIKINIMLKNICFVVYIYILIYSFDVHLKKLV